MPAPCARPGGGAAGPPAGAGAARRAAGGQAAHPRGTDQPRAPRRHLVLPPGRLLRRRGRALVRAGRPRRVDSHPRPPQLERAGHNGEPRLDRLVPQGVLAAALAEAGAPLLEGPLRGQQLPDQAVAERRGAGLLHRLLPVRGPAEEPQAGAQHARRGGLVAQEQLRPHPLAPGGLQRLRHWRLVELRRHPARGLRAQGRHRRRRGRPRAPAPRSRERPRAGGGAHDPPQLHGPRPRRRADAPARRPSATGSTPRRSRRRDAASCAPGSPSGILACGRRATPSSTT